MRMNTSIPMAGQSVDMFGAFMRGQQGRQQRNEWDHQNAFRAMMQEAGPGIVQGDQNALARLAQFDPTAALGVQQTRQGMAHADERMAMAREESRRAAAAAARAMSAAERQEQQQRLERGLAAAMQAQTPEQWDALAQQFGAPGLVGQWENRQAHIGSFLGIRDALTLSQGPQEQPGFRAATPEESAQFGAVGGQFGPDGRFYPINPPTGFEVITGADGQTTVRQGAGVAGAQRPLTEGQSRDNVYATRARGALTRLEPVADALMSRGDILLGMVPLGVGREMQSPDYQVALTAGDEFLQAILRKDTGAAITTQEREEYGRVYLPQPGDTPQVAQARREARARAMTALESGMSADQLRTVTASLGQAIVEAERLAEAGGQQQPAASAPRVDAAPSQPGGAAPAGEPMRPGEYRFNPATGQLEPVR